MDKRTVLKNLIRHLANGGSVEKEFAKSIFNALGRELRIIAKTVEGDLFFWTDDMSAVHDTTLKVIGLK